MMKLPMRTGAVDQSVWPIAAPLARVAELLRVDLADVTEAAERVAPYITADARRLWSLKLIGIVASLATRRSSETAGMRRRRPRPAPLPRSAFAGFRFPCDVIVLAVRWYLRFGLSYRDVEELLAERGVEVDHVTVYRWVQRFTPLLAEAARPCRHAVGDHWQVDETYVKVAGQWR